jgi:UDP-2,3-diacylglucosamine pyrophosphatase LpxH
MKVIKKAAVVSDLHLGEESSLLSSSSNIGRFAEQIARLGEIDELILIGDVMDFSLASLEEAYGNAQCFFKIICDLDTINEIVYVPGNHDHHLWFQLVEQDGFINKLANGELPPSENEYLSRFVDKFFPQGNNGTFLDPLFTNCQCQAKLRIKYPHHLRAFNKSHYLFTHGHFLEDVFKPVNIILEPGSLAELEAFNCLWLEAMWYHVGQSGRLGELVEEAYDDFKKGREEKIYQVADSAIDVLRERAEISAVPAWVLKRYIRHKLKKLAKKQLTRSSMRGTTISENLIADTKEYIDKFILCRYGRRSIEKQIPTPFTFVFGHTHRHFDDSAVDIDGLEYGLINTGGWLREDQENGCNAGILTIDSSGHQWNSFE